MTALSHADPSDLSFSHLASFNRTDRGFVRSSGDRRGPDGAPRPRFCASAMAGARDIPAQRTADFVELHEPIGSVSFEFALDKLPGAADHINGAAFGRVEARSAEGGVNADICKLVEADRCSHVDFPFAESHCATHDYNVVRFNQCSKQLLCVTM